MRALTTTICTSPATVAPANTVPPQHAGHCPADYRLITLAKFQELLTGVSIECPRLRISNCQYNTFPAITVTIDTDEPAKTVQRSETEPRRQFNNI